MPLGTLAREDEAKSGLLRVAGEHFVFVREQTFSNVVRIDDPVRSLDKFASFCRQGLSYICQRVVRDYL